jgi:hypothetical protein
MAMVTAMVTATATAWRKLEIMLPIRRLMQLQLLLEAFGLSFNFRGEKK